MEFCNGGSLEEVLNVRKTLTETEVWHVMKQVISGCKDMFEQNYLHRDIKTDNIVLHFPHYG